MKSALLILISIFLSLGAIAAQQDAHIVLYPNPAHERIYICGDMQPSSHVEVMNLIGEIVLNEELTNSAISIADLPSGIYVVKVYGAEGQLYYSSKLTKQ